MHKAENPSHKYAFKNLSFNNLNLQYCWTEVWIEIILEGIYTSLVLKYNNHGHSSLIALGFHK